MLKLFRFAVLSVLCAGCFGARPSFASTVGTVEVPDSYFHIKASKTFPMTLDGSDGPAAERYEQETKALLEAKKPEFNKLVNAWKREGKRAIAFDEKFPLAAEVSKEQQKSAIQTYDVSRTGSRSDHAGKVLIRFAYYDNYELGSVYVDVAFLAPPPENDLKEMGEQVFAQLALDNQTTGGKNDELGRVKSSTIILSLLLNFLERGNIK